MCNIFTITLWGDYFIFHFIDEEHETERVRILPKATPLSLVQK